MRWKASPKIHARDFRYKVKFAYLPILIDDKDRWVWWEKYIKVQQYYCGWDGCYWDFVKNILYEEYKDGQNSQS